MRASGGIPLAPPLVVYSASASRPSRGRRRASTGGPCRPADFRIVRGKLLLHRQRRMWTGYNLPLTHRTKQVKRNTAWGERASAISVPAPPLPIEDIE